ncbi:unnamed protein product [Fraxinus pennsylvanica]|uniref:Agenet domain-containing protein n=1 Tax=Fraxinus pennsylvanica TaxID=56036 RepID=A0AAD2E1F7_9LAMI|nr:unnamed protein product [Fraxinus pennsylvanica]
MLKPSRTLFLLPCAVQSLEVRVILLKHYAEAKTFETGYRGAWFRCKIREISWRKGEREYLLEYFDFPEEKLGLMNPYQFPASYRGMAKKKQRMLMVGDLVEWWTNDCYWSGRIKQLVGEDKAMIEFPKPPLGEGTPDEKASLKDLRPSLDWSPEYGWILPTPGGEKPGRPWARLIKPGDQGQVLEAGEKKAGSSPNESFSSHTSLITLAAPDELKGNETGGLHELSLGNTVLKELDTQETNIALDGGDSSTRKTCLLDTDSSSRMRETLAEPTTEAAEGDPYCSSCPLKKYPASGGMTSNSMGSNTLESAILDLEELASMESYGTRCFLIHAKLSAFEMLPEIFRYACF